MVTKSLEMQMGEMDGLNFSDILLKVLIIKSFIFSMEYILYFIEI